MQSYIKWITLFIGYMVGRFPGAILGFMLGYLLEEVLNGNLTFDPIRTTSTSPKFSDFQINLAILTSAVLRANGQITRKKVDYIRSFLNKQFGSWYGREIMKLINKYTYQSVDAQYVANDLRFETSKQGRIYLFRFLYGISHTEGTTQNKEQDILRTMAMNLGLTKEDYESVIQYYAYKSRQKADSKASGHLYTDPYRVLAVSPSATTSEIKKAYRKLVLKYHPDRTTLDKKHAEEQFNMISKAYQQIKALRHIK